MNAKQDTKQDTTVESRYRRLAEHCSRCPDCNADTSRACPQAHRLWRAWSRARRGASA